MKRWFCEAHRLWTATDCPKCDAEQIADIEAAYPPPARCHTCKRGLWEGDTAWASDWKVIDLQDRTVRREVRYTCDDCYTLEPLAADAPRTG